MTILVILLQNIIGYIALIEYSVIVDKCYNFFTYLIKLRYIQRSHTTRHSDAMLLSPQYRCFLTSFSPSQLQFFAPTYFVSKVNSGLSTQLSLVSIK